MYCNNCGSKLEDGTKFCGACGTPVSSQNSGAKSITINNLKDNPNMLRIAEMGCYEVFEHQKDLSVSPSLAPVAYFMHQMNMRRRQVLCTLNGNAIRVQAGAM